MWEELDFLSEETSMSTSEYKGIVTNLNEDFCLIELDNKWIVLLYKIFQNDVIGLPKLNETIEISNFYKDDLEDVIVLEKESCIKCENYTFPEQTIKFCEVALENNFSYCDLVFIQKVVNRYKKLGIFNPTFLERFKNEEMDLKITITDIFLQTFTTLPQKFSEMSTTLLNFDYNIEFTFPSNYDKKCPKLKGRDNLSLLSYTIQTLYNKNCLGYLYFNLKTCDLVLADGKMEIKIVTFTDTSNLKTFVNNFVVITDYIYVAEYFKTDEKKLEYLIIDLNDVNILKFDKKNISFENDSNFDLNDDSVLKLDKKICISFEKNPNFDDYLSEDEIHIDFLKKANMNLKCVVRNKSCVSRNIYRKGPKTEVFLHLLVIDPYNSSETFEILAFSKYFLENFSIIDVGTELEVKIDCFGGPFHFIERFLYKNNQEINRLATLNLTAVYIPSKLIKIGILRHDTSVPNLENISIASKNKSVSFTARILNKTLTSPNDSRSKLPNQSEGFGTIGYLTHTLFLTGVNENSKTVKMYLTNFENLKCPLGLLPDMIIKVRFALTQNTYLKSCAMTNFEIIEYQPLAILNIVYDFESDWNWGEPTFLGQYSSVKSISNGARVWVPIISIVFCSIEYSTKCNCCGKTLVPLQLFCCGEQNFIEDLDFCFFANDGFSPIKIVTKSRDVFYLILSTVDTFRSSKPVTDAIFEYLKSVRRYKYKFDFVPNFRNESVEILESIKILDQYFLIFQKPKREEDVIISCPLDLRLERDRDLWVCTEARVSVNAMASNRYFESINFFS